MTPGYKYWFRYQTVNRVGYSELSTDNFAYHACSAPWLMNRPVVMSVSSTRIEVAWTDPIDLGGCPLEQFEIYIDNG